MSHFTTIETQIRDIAALREACRELGVDGGRVRVGEMAAIEDELILDHG